MLNAVEAKLGHKLPTDIRAFYSAVRFIPPDDVTTDHGVDFSFRPPGEFRWVPLREFAAKPGDDWWQAEGLVFGDNLDYVVLMWVRGHRVREDGMIVLTGVHSFRDLQFVILARSLTEFLGKVAYFRGIQPGGANDAALEEESEAHADEPFDAEKYKEWYKARFLESMERDRAAVALFNAELAEPNSLRQAP